MGKVSAHGEGFGGFVGYNFQWTDAVIGVELNYTHGKFGGSQTGSMSRFFTLPSGYTVGATYEGPRGRGNQIDPGEVRRGLLERPLEDDRKVLQVGAGGELRNDAAIFRVRPRAGSR